MSSFKDLFEGGGAAVPERRNISIGDRLSGKVVHIGRDAVFVSIDAGREASMNLADAGKLKVGDEVEAVVVELEEGQIRLGRSLGKAPDLSELQLAKDENLIVEGSVTNVNKGGLEINLNGVRAFCPKSQASDRHHKKREDEELKELIGRTLPFKVIELDEGKVVLSHRRVLEEQRKAARDDLLATLSVGAEVKGTVREVRSFGAFVDLGGIDGLIPARELSHDRSVAPDDVLSAGDAVEVRVLQVELEEERPRITLSLRALSADPWDSVQTAAPPGTVVAGRVSKIMDYGAFVRIAAGLEGLLHVSELETSHPTDAVSVGDELLVAVKGIDLDKRRIALAPAPDGAKAGDAAGVAMPMVGSVIEVTVQKIERFGVFVTLPDVKGRAGRGLIPNRELGLESNADVRGSFPLGKVVRAKVLETGEGKLRLSIRAALDDAERAQYDGYRQEQAPPKSMGTLGDLLQKVVKK
ncbi:MAG: S1 RNA-binding domain-containing protein [Myxococcota bacterium]